MSNNNEDYHAIKFGKFNAVKFLRTSYILRVLIYTSNFSKNAFWNVRKSYQKKWYRKFTWLFALTFFLIRCLFWHWNRGLGDSWYYPTCLQLDSLGYSVNRKHRKHHNNHHVHPKMELDFSINGVVVWNNRRSLFRGFGNAEFEFCDWYRGNKFLNNAKN